MSTYSGETGFGPPYGRPARTGRRGILGAGVVLAILLAVAALIVAIVALTEEPPPAATPPAPPSQQGPTTDDDHKVCEAIAPLMKENDDRSNAFLGTGQPGSPEQDAALPKFVTDTQDWARRTQQVLDANANPPRLLTRTLQRYVDDMQLFVASVRPGAGTKYDEAAWTDSIVAYGGPLATCQALGVQW
ncbi:MAG: hypothetical protein QOG75_1861 [Mycobacterium sp.]|jgi:hypothetical protein|nr:hypothetical protein [Mycobacterium sp.]